MQLLVAYSCCNPSSIVALLLVRFVTFRAVAFWNLVCKCCPVLSWHRFVISLMLLFALKTCLPFLWAVGVPLGCLLVESSLLLEFDLLPRSSCVRSQFLLQLNCWLSWLVASYFFWSCRVCWPVRFPFPMSNVIETFGKFQLSSRSVKQFLPKLGFML